MQRSHNFPKLTMVLRDLRRDLLGRFDSHFKLRGILAIEDGDVITLAELREPRFIQSAESDNLR